MSLLQAQKESALNTSIIIAPIQTVMTGIILILDLQYQSAVQVVGAMVVDGLIVVVEDINTNYGLQGATHL